MTRPDARGGQLHACEPMTEQNGSRREPNDAVEVENDVEPEQGHDSIGRIEPTDRVAAVQEAPPSWP